MVLTFDDPDNNLSHKFEKNKMEKKYKYIIEVIHKLGFRFHTVKTFLNFISMKF